MFLIIPNMEDNPDVNPFLILPIAILLLLSFLVDGEFIPQKQESIPHTLTEINHGFSYLSSVIFYCGPNPFMNPNNKSIAAVISLGINLLIFGLTIQLML